MASYLNGFMSDYKNPDFYEYDLDGNGYFINDGGGDMFDQGNVTSPWLISNASYWGSDSYDTGNTGLYPYAINYQISRSVKKELLRLRKKEYSRMKQQQEQRRRQQMYQQMEQMIESLKQLIDVRALIQWGGIVGITSIIFVETGLFFGFN